jgi:hypothetical protein
LPAGRPSGRIYGKTESDEKSGAARGRFVGKVEVALAQAKI